MAFDHRDGAYFIITPLDGPNKGKGKRLLAVPKVSFDPGGKAAYLKGFEQTPVAIIRQAAEPKLEVDVSSGAEAWAVSQYVGGIGGYPFTVSHVFRRPGVKTQSFRFIQCELENGGGYESDENGVGSKLSIKTKDVENNGKSIYAKRAA